MSNLIHNFMGNSDVVTMSVFKKNWTLDETEKLLDIVRRQNTLQPVGNKKYRSIKAFENVSKELSKNGYMRTPEQVRAKLKALRRDFYLASKKPLAEARAEFSLFDELKDLLPSAPDRRFVQTVEEIPASVLVQECKKNSSSGLSPNPKKKKKINLENTVMSLMKDFMRQQKSNSRNFASVNHNKPVTNILSSEDESLERATELYVDYRGRSNKRKTEDSNSNFLKSLLPDLNKLCEQRQRAFKQNALMHLYKLLEDEEADRANGQDQSYNSTLTRGGSSPQPQIYLEQAHAISPDQSSCNPVTVELKIDKIK